MNFRLMAVHAHPDDESSKGAATLAYYASRGVDVVVVSCTGGEQGSILNSRLRRMAKAERDMAGLRRDEMAAAQRLLGVGHRWLGYRDSGMPQAPDTVRADSFAGLPIEITSKPLVKVIRECRPQVVVTYGVNGDYPHPDHVRAHDVTMRAIEDAASDRLPQLGAPWQVLKTYYDRGYSVFKLRALAAAARERGVSVPEGIDRMIERVNDAGVTLTTSVPSSEFFERRDAALLAHESQVAPDSGFFAWPIDLQRDVWPQEDFELAHSAVPTTVPETDLFEGIDPSDD